MIILGADVGIPLEDLSPKEKQSFIRDLTVTSNAWRTNQGFTVRGYYEKDNHFWIPRHYAFSKGIKPDIDKTTQGKPQNLEFTLKLDPTRGQVDAVPKMVEYLKKHQGGALIAGTGTGKTALSYAIASEFKTSIGVFIYVGHMVDNWIKEAYKVFGISKDEIGIVQRDRVDLGKPITLMSVQSLISREYPKELYEQFGIIINDESQRFGSEKWSNVWRLFPAKYRLAATADIIRKDGLTDVISWNIGEIGHTIKKHSSALQVQKVHIDVDYPFNSYKSWTPDHNGIFPADPMKYDKKLSKDNKRNQLIANIITQARKPGKRRILVFSRLRKHLDTLKEMVDSNISKDSSFPATTTALMVGGQKKDTRDAATASDIIFTTYSYARDALNITSLDTMFFATPPGDPLQPAGRLRDKGDANRESLMLVDFHESTEYSKRKWLRRKEFYDSKNYAIKDYYKAIDK